MHLKKLDTGANSVVHVMYTSTYKCGARCGHLATLPTKNWTDYINLNINARLACYRCGVDGWEDDGGNLPLASFSWDEAGSYWASYPSLHKPLYGLRGGSTSTDPVSTGVPAIGRGVW
ncbi:jg19890 [Pararge aegeria aegeria]|uniref:Jg19890 protein n=1 Tax=Pararge aegeria aegeria TaxID=348720 RepID=A0A8S4SL62_9NEOP|nr:jg19890 [Pararge aegeria aegeria]